MEEKNKSLSVPGAIVVAGLVVAVAIIFTSGGGPRVDSENSNQEASVTKSVLGEDFYTEIAVDLGLDKKDFLACFNSDLYDEDVRADLEEGTSLGITGTPTSFILAENGEAFRIRGALKYEEISPFIDQAISGTLKSEENLSKLKGIQEGDHVLGNVNAPVTLIEYSDLECPFCASFHPTAERIVEDYEGKVNWVYRHFPLSRIHPQAGPAAVASECVADLGGNEDFWEFIERVFKKA